MDVIRNDKNISKKFSFLNDVLKTIDYFETIIHKRTAGEIVWDICEELNILKPRSQRYLVNDRYVILNIGNLLLRAQKFSENIKSNKTDNLYSFNLYLEAVIKSGGLPSIAPHSLTKNNCVNVNTVHGVKGGEFKIVFLPFQRSASFPLNYRSEKRISTPPDSLLHYANHTDLSPRDHHYQEERRLFYVAITRAKELLYIL